MFLNPHLLEFSLLFFIFIYSLALYLYELPHILVCLTVVFGLFRLVAYTIMLINITLVFAPLLMLYNGVLGVP